MKRLPMHVVQFELLPFFSSLEVFKLRLVSVKWAEAIKIAWCLSAKQEMLTHVKSLDILYEKETISKIMDFKLNYIMACNEVMASCFSQLPMKELLVILLSTGLPCAKQLAFAIALIVCPRALLASDPNIDLSENVWEERHEQVVEFIQSEEFMVKYLESCRLESMPVITAPNLFAYVKELMSSIDLSDLQSIEQ
eukprot:TRINITY_DN2741_c0_g1_i9.p2 TRINITY_DN2741_c0_g1~~TRINITY_DN2741_c0_g1_i9.p2  ORF type:complete len:195 (-),score=65.55 TRINITY_DN2741_c0_g1_i9:216-800(-)